MGNLRYSSYSAETADAEKAASESEGKNYMKLKVGRNVVRILPPPEGESSVFKVVYQHFLELPGKKGSFMCPRIMNKQHCPICAKADELKASGRKADMEAANDLFARRRVFCSVIDRADEAAGPKVLGIGKTVHEPLLDMRRNEDVGGDFAHPIEGFDIIITRTGTGKNDTKYTVSAARNNSQLAGDEETMQGWIDGQADLSAIARLPDAEAMAEFLGTDAEEAPPPRKQLPASRATATKTASTPRSTARSARTIDDDAEDIEEAE